MTAAQQAANEFTELLVVLQKSAADPFQNKNRISELLRLVSGINVDAQLLEVIQIIVTFSCLTFTADKGTFTHSAAAKTS